VELPVLGLTFVVYMVALDTHTSKTEQTGGKCMCSIITDVSGAGYSQGRTRVEKVNT
jgi:hypothetical protein